MRALALAVMYAAAKELRVISGAMLADIQELEGTGERVTMRELERRLAAIGYRLDKSMTCRAPARFMTGPLAGVSHPNADLYPVEKDSGRSAFHFQARRDSNYESLQALRTCYAVAGKYHASI